MATPHVTQARKDLIAAYLLAGSASLGPEWAGGFAAGMTFAGELSRRDPAIVPALGALIEAMGREYVPEQDQQDITAVATMFIRAWDLAAG